MARDWLAAVASLRWKRLAGPLALLALWQVFSTTGVLSARVLAPPSSVLATGYGLVRSGELAAHLWVSLGRVARGVALGVGTGLVLALAAGLSRAGEDLLDPPLQMLRTLPVLALVPLFILWFGIGETPKILLIALATLFPIYLNTYAGIRNIDQKLVEAASSLSCITDIAGARCAHAARHAHRSTLRYAHAPDARHARRHGERGGRRRRLR